MIEVCTECGDDELAIGQKLCTECLDNGGYRGADAD